MVTCTNGSITNGTYTTANRHDQCIYSLSTLNLSPTIFNFAGLVDLPYQQWYTKLLLADHPYTLIPQLGSN